jgi:hypothetical protein
MEEVRAISEIMNEEPVSTSSRPGRAAVDQL